MKLSLEKRFGWIHVRGGRVLRVRTAHPVSTATFFQRAAEAVRDAVPKPGKVAPSTRFGDKRTVDCKVGDLVVEIVNAANGRLVGWSYLTGPAANLNRYSDVADVYAQDRSVRVARYMVPVAAEGAVIARQMTQIRYGIGHDAEVVVFALTAPGREMDFGRAITELWQMYVPGDEEPGQPGLMKSACHFMGIIDGGTRRSPHVALHFQTAEHASDWPANPFQMGLLLSAPGLPTLELADDAGSDGDAHEDRPPAA